MARSGVRGVKRTVRNIRKLGTTMRRPVAEASRAALRPILKSAKSKLTKNGSAKRGVLRKGMVIRQKKSRKGSIETVVAAKGRARSIAHLVEFGTDPHWQPKRGVMHPGADPKPFLTPAYEENEKQSIEKFGEVIGPAIERQAERLNRRK